MPLLVYVPLPSLLVSTPLPSAPLVGDSRLVPPHTCAPMCHRKPQMLARAIRSNLRARSRKISRDSEICVAKKRLYDSYFSTRLVFFVTRIFANL